MSEKLKLPEPWPMSFDEANGVWCISASENGNIFPVAQISCQFDDYNGRRRHAAHLMANADRMYAYLHARSECGDVDASALIEEIQVTMMTNKAEERAMQSPSLNPR